MMGDKYRDTDDELEGFKRVEKISELISKMTNSDYNLANEATVEAEALLEKIRRKTEFNKTVINKKAIDTPSGDRPTESGTRNETSVEAFKATVEADSRERFERRAKRRLAAEKIKKEGNEFFKAGDWENAINMFSQAIDVCKDFPVLYTNRALAYLRVDEPEKALSDCDAALFLLGGETSLDAGTLNEAISKAHLHRGKALLALARPADALEAYDRSRHFYRLARTSAARPLEALWPDYLKEYIHQAEAALSAQLADATADDFLHRPSGDSSHKGAALTDTEAFFQLMKEGLSSGQEFGFYSAILRRLTDLLLKASKSDLTSVNVEKDCRKSTQIQDLSSGSKHGSDPPLIQVNGKYHNGDVSNYSSDAATVQQLQTLFRVKDGFSLLKSRLKLSEESGEFTSAASAFAKPHRLEVSDHLLAIINLCVEVCKGCGENQRILSDRLPSLFSHLLTDCLQISPSTSDIYQNPKLSKTSLLEDERRHRHKLSCLQYSACQLLMVMSSAASGREALLAQPGVSRLLSAFAVALSDAPFSPPKQQDQLAVRKVQLAQPTFARSAYAAHTVTAISRLLENLTTSPHFLSQVRACPNSMSSLLSVTEAMLVAPSNGASSHCLAMLLDGLSAVCRDSALRCALLQRLLHGLTQCLLRHAPLIPTPSHADLVGSLCRLLHNSLAGELSSGSSYSPLHLEALLRGIGLLLDQPSHGPLLRSLAIALLGRVLPISSQDMVEQWCETGLPIRLGEDKSARLRRNPDNFTHLKERVYLLLAVVESHSSCGLKKLSANPELPGPVDGAGMSRGLSEMESLEAHCLRGSVRALASITGAVGCANVRFAIGDDRCLSRRIASLLRASRDEVLLANVCILLQNCLDDTPLAEYLIGTSVILDLLKFIQESNRLEAKRNAAILIGKLAKSNPAHYDELSKHDGFSVLTPFNKWSSLLNNELPFQ